jgi:hypothetical protein
MIFRQFPPDPNGPRIFRGRQEKPLRHQPSPLKRRTQKTVADAISEEVVLDIKTTQDGPPSSPFSNTSTVSLDAEQQPSSSSEDEELQEQHAPNLIPNSM